MKATISMRNGEHRRINRRAIAMRRRIDELRTTSSDSATYSMLLGTIAEHAHAIARYADAAQLAACEGEPLTSI